MHTQLRVLTAIFCLANAFTTIACDTQSSANPAAPASTSDVLADTGPMPDATASVLPDGGEELISDAGPDAASKSCRLAVARLKRCILAIDCPSQMSPAHCQENKRLWGSSNYEQAKALLAEEPGIQRCNGLNATRFLSCPLNANTCECEDGSPSSSTNVNRARWIDQDDTTWVLGQADKNCEEACDLEHLKVNQDANASVRDATACEKTFGELIAKTAQVNPPRPSQRNMDIYLGCWAEVERSQTGPHYRLRYAADGASITSTSHGPGRHRVCACK